MRRLPSSLAMPGATSRMPTIEKTLIFRLSSIGDVVLTTPFLRIFRRARPEARIDFVIRREFADLLRHHPAISRLHEIDTGEGREGLLRWREIFAAEGYDRIFDLHNNFRTKIMRAGLKSPVAVIDKRTLRRWLLVKMKWNLLRDAPPVAERYIETGADLDLIPDGEGAEIFIPEATVEAVRGRFGAARSRQPVVGLCPGAAHGTKRWPVEYYTLLGKRLAESRGATIVIFGNAEDRPLGRAIAEGLGKWAENWCGELSILETAAAMDFCDLVVTNDTGLMHIAGARKRPLIGIFGSTVREFGFSPYKTAARIAEVAGLSCRPCSHLGFPSCPKIHFRCMKEIAPGQVAAMAERMLSGEMS